MRRILGLLARGFRGAFRGGRATQGATRRLACLGPTKNRRTARRSHGLVRARDPGELSGQARDALATHVLLDGDGLERLDALGGARPRLLSDDPRDEVLAQVGAQVGEVARVLRRREHAHGHRVLVGGGDLHAPRAPVPQVGGGQELFNLGANQRHGRGPVKLEFDRAQLGGGAARPVLEGGLREVAAGDDEAALVPDAHDHVGQRDLLDRAGFLLIAGDHDVTHADRVSEGQLQAGDDVTEGLLRGETEDHRDDTGGRKDGRHGMARGVEGPDDGDRTHDGDDHLGEAPQDLGASLEAAREAVVGCLAGLCCVLEDPRGGVAHPRHARQAHDEEQVHEERRDGGATPIRQPRIHERNAEANPRSPRRERKVGGAAHAVQDRRGHGGLSECPACEDGQDDRRDNTQAGSDDGPEEQEGDVDGGVDGCLCAGLRICGGERERIGRLGEGTEYW